MEGAYIWRDDSVFKNGDYSSKGPKLTYQTLTHVGQLITSFRGTKLLEPPRTRTFLCIYTNTQFF